MVAVALYNLGKQCFEESGVDGASACFWRSASVLTPLPLMSMCSLPMRDKLRKKGVVCHAPVREIMPGCCDGDVIVGAVMRGSGASFFVSHLRTKTDGECFKLFELLLI